MSIILSSPRLVLSTRSSAHILLSFSRSNGERIVLFQGNHPHILLSESDLNPIKVELDFSNQVSVTEQIEKILFEQIEPKLKLVKIKKGKPCQLGFSQLVVDGADNIPGFIIGPCVVHDIWFK